MGLFLSLQLDSIDQPVCLFLCQYHAAIITIALQYSLKSGMVIPPEVLLLYRIVLAILRCLCFFPCKGENCSFKVQKELCWNFDGNCTMLILPIHEHGTSFHLLISSFISFFRDLKFFHAGLSFALLELR